MSKIIRKSIWIGFYFAVALLTTAYGYNRCEKIGVGFPAGQRCGAMAFGYAWPIYLTWLAAVEVTKP